MVLKIEYKRQVYGEIEENCNLKALFDSNIDRIKDIANKQLFG